jgi:hypothetical protein
MDGSNANTPIVNVGFSQKLTCKGTWLQVFICLGPPLPGFCLEMVKQLCRFRIIPLYLTEYKIFI